MNLTNPIYHDADKAREHLEALHWPNGPVCPHCGVINEATKLQGKSTRKGVYKCNACEKPFTVTVGTVMEDSKIPLNKWVLAFALVNASKKGFSAHQLHRQLGITYKSAWFMHHRIREAMRMDCDPMGGEGCTVEVDETFIGKDKSAPPSRTPFRNMNKVVTLVDRSTGRATSFHVTDNLDATTISGILYTNVRRKLRRFPQWDKTKDASSEGRRYYLSACYALTLHLLDASNKRLDKQKRDLERELRENRSNALSSYGISNVLQAYLGLGTTSNDLESTSREGGSQNVLGKIGADKLGIKD